MRLVFRPLPFVGINRRRRRGLIWIRRISLETGSRSAALQLFKKVPAEPPVSGNMFCEISVGTEERPVSRNMFRKVNVAAAELPVSRNTFFLQSASGIPASSIHLNKQKAPPGPNMDPTYFPRNRDPLCGFPAIQKGAGGASCFWKYVSLDNAAPAERPVSRNMFRKVNVAAAEPPVFRNTFFL
ncbi:hypothetical protein DYBT9623_04145 [Dyadobacter sp. CECT 9623]|uniref:Uncharacterized protein n=1 Tax=Dyadobacter linearis TaxID=2823330 RepID=A0ABM8UUX7_9BACT|nr:hypothetical protein DYBT9623_04145 [Dyadobacter sp. CECT 9623]